MGGCCCDICTLKLSLKSEMRVNRGRGFSAIDHTVCSYVWFVEKLEALLTAGKMLIKLCQ